MPASATLAKAQALLAFPLTPQQRQQILTNNDVTGSKADSSKDEISELNSMLLLFRLVCCVIHSRC